MMLRPSTRFVSVLVLASILATPLPVAAIQEAPASATSLTREEQREFLLTAKVTRTRSTSKGVTSPTRLTLTDGRTTRDAVFQRINDRRMQAQFARGGGEVNFVDSYLYNLAAYELASMLDLDHMMPVTVPYRWRGTPGSLSWWVDWKWDEGMRLKEKISPPNPGDWNNQMHRMRVFAQLVYDTDRNLGNVLITEDWKVYMIDFTRAFRLHRELPSAADLLRCDRGLFERLRALDAGEVRARLKPHLTGPELNALLARRDLIVAHFEELIALKGEAAVLY
jgi:hypothetical protein